LRPEWHAARSAYDFKRNRSKIITAIQSIPIYRKPVLLSTIKEFSLSVRRYENYPIFLWTVRLDVDSPEHTVTR
jgi:hypothetical protein